MERGITGNYEPSVAAGEACQAFVPHPLPPDPLLTVDSSLQERLDEAHLALGRLDSITMLLPETSVFLYSYVRKEAVMSSQIEGTQSSLSDLMLYEAEGAPGVPLDDVREVSCYVAALEHGLHLLKGGLPLCVRLMNEMHAKLMTHGRGAGKSPGEIRRTQNWIGGASPSRASFVPPPPQRVGECLSDLEKFLNDQPVRHPALIKAALSHVQFETIHPYLDGNGRLGRLLIPLILVHEGVLREPLLYLSLYFKTYRNNYYEMLQRVRQHGDWEEWLWFFATAVRYAASQAVDTAKALTKLGDTDREHIKSLGRVSPSALQVHQAMFGRPVTTIPAICATTGQSPHTVNKMLDAMIELGLVRELTGMRRNRIYEYTAYLELLNREGGQ
ncbi:MAG: Fic family protein [Pseudomonadota bacterium]